METRFESVMKSNTPMLELEIPIAGRVFAVGIKVIESVSPDLTDVLQTVCSSG